MQSDVSKQTEPKKGFKDFKDGRFEYALLMNDIIICKRWFHVPNFIEGVFNTLEFKYTVDDIVDLIDSDLKAKSRVYTWYNYRPEEPKEGNEFFQELPEPWDCTFKFVVYDNGREVFSKIWDGYAYPRYVRGRIDLTNDKVKITDKYGNTYTYNKQSYFESHGDKLYYEQRLLKSMIMDRPNLLQIISRMLVETCSPVEEVPENEPVTPKNSEKYLRDFTTKEKYSDVVYDLKMPDYFSDYKKWNKILRTR